MEGRVVWMLIGNCDWSLLIAINYFNRRLIALKEINRCTALKRVVLVHSYRSSAASGASLGWIE